MVPGDDLYFMGNSCIIISSSMYAIFLPLVRLIDCEPTTIDKKYIKSNDYSYTVF